MIGVISDTHDNLRAVSKAVEYFNESKVGLVLHAGDYVSPFVSRVFKKSKSPIKGVFGNNDGDRVALLKSFKGVADITPQWRMIEIKGYSICLTHKPLPERPGGCELYVFGHTHEPVLEKSEDGSITINPGDCSGWLSGRNTVGIVDPEKKKAQIIEL